MKPKKMTGGDRYKLCRRKACATACSIQTGSIFFDSKGRLKQLTRLLYEWAAKSPVNRAMTETGLSRCDVLETREVLHELIQRHVVSGTRILSDCWAGYNGLGALGYEHATVNHSRNFVDPLQGDVHTQRIENVWRWLKHFLRQKRPNIHGSFEGCFAEHMFRKEHKTDVFAALVDVLARETC
uniref:DDE_Tnp_IS1595 domain-containing protein n=1 Tax=Anopheles funestus TaxID=62324 RepID=A0A182RMF9_ANOFN